MDINMSNVTLYKGEDGDNWIYLSLDGGTTNGIKLIYDDGTYRNIKDLQQRIRYMESWNALNKENNGIAFYEFYTDEIWSAAKNAFSRTKNVEHLEIVKAI